MPSGMMSALTVSGRGKVDVGGLRTLIASTEATCWLPLGAHYKENWAQTIPGKGWNTLLRLYSLLDPWFNKTWRPGEIELVK